MIKNLKLKTMTQQDFFDSERNSPRLLLSVLLIVSVYFFAQITTYIYYYFTGYQGYLTILEFLKLNLLAIFQLEGFVKRHGIIILLLIFPALVHFKKLNRAKHYARTRLLTLPARLSWDESHIVIEDENGENRSHIYWSDFINVKVLPYGINLYITSFVPIRIPFDWFDSKDNLIDFTSQVKKSFPKSSAKLESMIQKYTQ